MHGMRPLYSDKVVRYHVPLGLGPPARSPWIKRDPYGRLFAVQMRSLGLPHDTYVGRLVVSRKKGVFKALPPQALARRQKKRRKTGDASPAPGRGKKRKAAAARTTPKTARLTSDIFHCTLLDGVLNDFFFFSIRRRFHFDLLGAGE